LKVNREGHNVLGYRIHAAHITGFGGEVAPPTHRFYSGGEQDLRGFDTRSVAPYVFIPNKVDFTLTNPDGTSVPLNPANPALGNVIIPLPIYRMVSIGGDTQFIANLEYRIPIVSQVTFAFFTDFGMDFDAQPGQLRQSTAGNSLISGAQYGCPTIVNGACFGGSSVKFPEILSVVPGTNYVPRMSNGAELQVILPIINAPFRIFYAYNSLRLYEDIPQKLAVPNSGPDNVNTFKGYFPTNGAGQFSYQQALQLYGADYILREPRKTFRLTVSTTF
jgi:outer membrane protein insertion porin family